MVNISTCVIVHRQINTYSLSRFQEVQGLNVYSLEELWDIASRVSEISNFVRKYISSALRRGWLSNFVPNIFASITGWRNFYF